MKKSAIRILVTSLLVILAPGFIYSQVFPVEVVQYNGSPDRNFNIVVMGDGYTAEQQGKFIADVSTAINGFLLQEPFKTYRDSINVFAIKVVSNVEGAAERPSSLIDNYFGSTFWSYGIERLLTVSYGGRVSNVLQANTPFYDEGVIIVNSTKYGGSGGQYAVLSTHSESIELLLHEFGHSFASLADEYWAGSQYAQEKTNMTQDNNPETIRWKNFLNVNGVGIYPHAESPTWYRPHQNCKMRYLGSPFCEVCRHKISLDIMAIANDNTAGLPVAYFAANSLSVTSGATVAFYDMSSFSPTSWEWTFEGGSPATSTDKNPVVNYPNPGEFAVSLKASNSEGTNTYTRNKYIRVSKASGIEPGRIATSITLYPNPAREAITVYSDNTQKPDSYRIVNVLGVCLTEGAFENTIDVSNLPKGYYLMQFTVNGALVTKTFVKGE
jgi:hypothetical protein